MEKFSVETIVNENDRGFFEEFNSYSKAKKFAIKESLKKGVIETFINGFDETQANFEVMEYYKNGKLSIKVS